MLRDFCKTQEDFDTLKEYNDYLEFVEDIIFNLANNVDVEETRQKVHDYKEANKAFITKHRNKMSSDYMELEDIIAEEKRVEAKRKHEDAVIDAESKTAKLRDKEKLIDDLMFSDKDSKAIIEEHAKNTQFATAADFKAAKKDYNKPAPRIIEAKPYEYIELLVEFEGPEPPLNEEMVAYHKFNKHIKPAADSEKAAGYIESIGACRALQEAMSGLYFDSF